MLRWLLLPLHAGALLSGSKDYRRNPLIGSVTLNRRGLHVGRARLAESLAAWRRARLAGAVAAEDRAHFDKEGYIRRDNFLPPETFAALRAELQALRTLLEDPVWRGTLRYVAASAAEPLVYIQTILTHAAPGAEADPQTALHMDTFHPNMKAWFYLQDVPEEVGPLAFVPGSHRLTRRRQAWERTRSVVAAQRRIGGAFRIAEEALLRLQLPPPRRLAVPANTLVGADVRGFHARSRTAQPSMRVEIYAISRPNPFLPLLRGPADWVPTLARRRAALPLRLPDALARLGLARAVWRRAPDGSPFDPPAGSTAP
ncbi:phytanoyl-CoA dioxygenase family protein [Falsiroseomonas selenitidurans]|uniref:Phytanoyl-CoA dioxygenase n=1 Tax=Falsiroseomonas selenitidurans TaxID=2716335 RepID=A0ABX1EAU3_9PROT|nr:phytanoyl-CoA dioxygenase family protein [Falsiroseomonas selenitidurans]NKC34354.1 phytanoyl-CoA dioxygenase [Falsiroseomonas selenitidurans]